MRIGRKKLTSINLLYCLVLLFSMNVYAQDPQFSQFYANQLYLNPAFAGSSYGPKISLNHRTQWAGLSGSFLTTSASYDQQIDALSGGIGLIVLDDRAGESTLKTTSVSGIYSYELQVNRKFTMRFGLQATWSQKKLDWDKLTFGDEIDPRRGFIFNTNEVPRDDGRNFVDFSAGILGYTKNFYFGFAAHHLAEPNESVIQGDSPLPRKLTFHGGYVIPVTNKGNSSTISPNVLIQIQDNFQQVNLGMYYTNGPLTAGLWYRTSDAIILSLGVQTGILKIGYSYDITVSKLSNASTGGSHEVSTVILIDRKPKSRKFRTISCPSF